MSQQSKFRNEEPLTREVSSSQKDQHGKSEVHLTKDSTPNANGVKNQSEIKTNEVTPKHEERVGIFTGKKQEGVPSLFDHLPKPDFKDVFSKAKVQDQAPVSGSKDAHGHEHKKEVVETAVKENGEKEKLRVAEKQPDPAPLNLFGKPVGDLFKQPSQPLFAVAASKPEASKTTDQNDDKKAAGTAQESKPEKSLFGHLAPGSVGSLFGPQSTPVQGLFGSNPPAASLFSNQTTQQTSLFGNPQAGTTSLFASKPPTTGLFSQGSSLFSGQSNGVQSQSIFFNKPAEDGEGSDAEGGEEGAEDEPDKKSEENYNPAEDGQAFVYVSPYEQVFTAQFEDLKIDKKDGIGIGIISIEKLKPKEPTSDKKEESKDTKTEQPQSIRFDFPLLVVKTKAKVILGTYKMIPKRSSSAFLKSNNSCVSVTAFQIQKGEGNEAAKLVTFNVKVKFADEKTADEFKKEFDKLVH